MSAAMQLACNMFAKCVVACSGCLQAWSAPRRNAAEYAAEAFGCAELAAWPFKQTIVKKQIAIARKNRDILFSKSFAKDHRVFSFRIAGESSAVAGSIISAPNPRESKLRTFERVGRATTLVRVWLTGMEEWLTGQEDKLKGRLRPTSWSATGPARRAT
jgi:hypothetical protein